MVQCCRPSIGRIGCFSMRLSVAVLHLARELLLTVCGDQGGRYDVLDVWMFWMYDLYQLIIKLQQVVEMLL